VVHGPSCAQTEDMNEERKPTEPTAEAKREAEEARLLEELAEFEEELPHGRPAAAWERALAIVYKDEAEFLTRRRRAPAAGQGAPPAPDATPEPDHDPGPGATPATS